MPRAGGSPVPSCCPAPGWGDGTDPGCKALLTPYPLGSHWLLLLPDPSRLSSRVFWGSTLIFLQKQSIPNFLKKTVFTHEMRANLNIQY